MSCEGMQGKNLCEFLEQNNFKLLKARGMHKVYIHEEIIEKENIKFILKRKLLVPFNNEFNDEFSGENSGKNIWENKIISSSMLKSILKAGGFPPVIYTILKNEWLKKNK